MSGVARGIKKVFSKVANVTKKIALPALAVAGVVLTGGAALGLAPMAGGFGGAISGALGAVGLPTTGAIGTALTGAVTKAGYGAAIGGIGSVATGGKFAEGAKTGGLAGAIVGGIGGLAQAAAPAASGALTPLATSAKNVPTGLATAAPSGVAPTIANPAAVTGAANAGNATQGLAGNLTGVAGKALGGLGRFASTEGGGHVLAGLGQGLVAGMAAKDAAEQNKLVIDAQREEERRLSDSYDLTPAAYESTPEPDRVDRPSSREKYGRTPRYRWDRDKRRIVYGDDA